MLLKSLIVTTRSAQRYLMSSRLVLLRSVCLQFCFHNLHRSLHPSRDHHQVLLVFKLGGCQYCDILCNLQMSSEGPDDDMHRQQLEAIRVKIRVGLLPSMSFANSNCNLQVFQLIARCLLGG